ncbi:MAG: hypothetical protein LBP74_04950 [Treponema sp.]|nr:hypothetical protein [Treponema sp.]
MARYSGALRLLTPFLSVPEMNLPALNLNVTRKSRSDYLYSRMGNRQGAEGTQISAVDIPLSTADIPLSAADISLSAADISLFMMVKKSLKMAGKPVKPDSRIKKTKKEGT